MAPTTDSGEPDDHPGRDAADSPAGTARTPPSWTPPSQQLPPGWSGADWQSLDGGRSAQATSQPEPLEHQPNRTNWLHTSVQEWVSRWLGPTISLELTATSPYWCSQWWRHAEAVARLDALWRAWEFYREQTCDPTNPAPAGMSLWWRDHGNPHLEVLLMSSRSPFRLCTRGIHSAQLDPPLPTVDPPPSWAAESISCLRSR